MEVELESPESTFWDVLLKKCSACCWRARSRNAPLAGSRCQKGKFGTDRCIQERRQLQRNPAKEFKFEGSSRVRQRGRPTFWCLLAWIDFWKHIYLGSRFIQNGLFLARPDPMNHVWGADLSESPNIPPVVAKAPSQCGRSFKTRRQKLSKHKILLVASNGQKCIFQIHKAILILENIRASNR